MKKVYLIATKIVTPMDEYIAVHNKISKEFETVIELNQASIKLTDEEIVIFKLKYGPGVYLM